MLKETRNFALRFRKQGNALMPVRDFMARWQAPSQRAAELSTAVPCLVKHDNVMADWDENVALKALGGELEQSQ